MRAVVMADKRTREIVRRFESAADAARAFGLNKESLARKCRNRTLQHGQHYFRYEEDFDPDEDFTGHMMCPVLVQDTLTGMVEWFPSRKTAASALCYCEQSINAAISKKCRLGGRYRVADAGRRLE